MTDHESSGLPGKLSRLSYVRSNRHLHRVRSAAWLLFLLILVYLLALRIPVMLRYNGAVVQLAKNVVPSASESNTVHLTTEQRQSLVLQFQRLQNQMINDSLVRYHLGQLAFWSGDYGETINQLKLHPGERLSPLAKLLLGYALWNTGQIDKAVATWRSAPDIRYYLLHQAARAEHDRNYELAEATYQLIMTLAPDWAAAEAGYWFAHSMKLLEEENHNPDEVDWVVEQYLDLNDPGRPRRLTELGAALYRQGKLELAKASLMLGIQLEPYAHWPRYYLGLVYYEKQAYRLAEGELLRAVEITPGFGKGHHWLARSLVQLGQADRALAHYHMAIRLLPGNTKLANELKALEERLQQE